MKRFLFIILSIITFDCYSQSAGEYKTDELGIGLITFKNIEFLPDSLIFYKDKELKTPHQLVYSSTPDKKVHPKFYKPEEKICYFVCVESTINYYKIIVNKSDQYYIVNNAGILFKSWDNLLTKSNGIIRTDKLNLFRSEPMEMGGIVNLSNKEERYKGVLVKDEWLKVKNEQKQTVAWLKWKLKNHLLVEIVF